MCNGIAKTQYYFFLNVCKAISNILIIINITTGIKTAKSSLILYTNAVIKYTNFNLILTFVRVQKHKNLFIL